MPSYTLVILQTSTTIICTAVPAGLVCLFSKPLEFAYLQLPQISFAFSTQLTVLGYALNILNIRDTFYSS
jgi:hypothetical protein